jgi:hypothetical protein
MAKDDDVQELLQAQANALLCGRLGLKDDIRVEDRETVVLSIPVPFIDLDGFIVKVRLEVEHG